MLSLPNLAVQHLLLINFLLRKKIVLHENNTFYNTSLEIVLNPLSYPLRWHIFVRNSKYATARLDPELWGFINFKSKFCPKSCNSRKFFCLRKPITFSQRKDKHNTTNFFYQFCKMFVLYTLDIPLLTHFSVWHFLRSFMLDSSTHVQNF